MQHFVWDCSSIDIGLTEVDFARPSALEYFKELVDSYRGTTNSLAYYDVLAGDWLFHFMHQVYAALQEVLFGYVSGKGQPIPVDPHLATYRGLYLQDKFSNYLRWAVTDLLDGHAPDNWVFECDSTIITSGSNKRLLSQIVRGISTNNPDVLLSVPYFKCSRTEWLRALWKWRHWAAWDDLQYPFKFALNVDVKWRKSKAVEVGKVSDFEGLLRVLLPLNIPVVLLEGFSAYRRAVLNFPVSRPKVVYSANALYGHMAFKLLVAEWRDQGTLLLFHQHGGSYGLDRIHACEKYETRVSDRYYTFGWYNSDRPHVKPLSAPPLSSQSRLRKRILLSCVNFPNVVYRLHFHPMPGSIQTMQRETCEFLSALPDHKKLMVRPYSNDYGWGFTEMMRKVAPNASFDDRRTSSFARYSESRLVVHNYLGTGWLETLALDIPTVCFFDIDTYAFRESAQPYIDALERIGVLHHSGVSAARFVAALGNNIESWWRTAEVQDVRHNFVSRYANFSPDWKEQWEREFSLLLAEAG